MAYQKHSVEFDDQPPLKFLVERHWWILTILYIDEQGRVCELEGKYSIESKSSVGHPERKIFDLSQVRNPAEVFDKICEIEEECRGTADDHYSGYVIAFAAGHKPGCLMARPDVRKDILDGRENIKEKFKEFEIKLSDAEAIDHELKLRATLCTCNTASGD